MSSRIVEGIQKVNCHNVTIVLVTDELDTEVTKDVVPAIEELEQLLEQWGKGRATVFYVRRTEGVGGEEYALLFKITWSDET
jgi:hypothetical protein